MMKRFFFLSILSKDDIEADGCVPQDPTALQVPQG